MFPFSALGHEKQEVCAAVLQDFPPLYIIGSDGVPEGFAIDLLDEIARQNDLQISYVVAQNWAEAMDLVRQGKADVIPGISRTNERLKEFAFTHDVVSIKVSCFVKKGNDKIHNIEFLRDNKYVVGVIKSSTAQTRLEEIGGYRLKQFTNVDAALSQLLAGEIDAFVYPEWVLMDKLQKMTIDDKIMVVGEPLMFLHRGYLVAKGNDKLLKIFEDAIDTVMKDSYYADLYVKWYGRHAKAEGIPVWVFLLIVGLILLVIVCVVFNLMLQYQVKRRTEEIRASHKFVNNLIEATECVTLTLSEQFEIKYANRCGLELFGYKENEIVGKNALELLVPEVDSNGKNVRKELLEKLKNIDSVASHINQNITKGGDLLWVLWTNNIMTNASTGEREIVSIGFDITAQKEAEMQLVQAQQELEVIIDNMAGAMLYLDNDLNIVRINREAERVAGKNKDDIIGKKCYEILCQKDSPCPDCSASSAIETGERSRNENLILLNGSNYDVISTPIKDVSGKVTGTISILNDVTKRRSLETNLKNAHNALEQYTRALESKVEAGNVQLEKKDEDLKAAQKQLIQSEKMASLGRLIAGIGHEINSPLGAIRSSGEIIHNAFEDFFDSFDTMVGWASSEHRHVLFDMLKESTSANMLDVSSKERRAYKNTVMNILDEMGVSNSYELAQRMVDMGLYKDVEKYDMILKSPDVEQRLKVVHNLAQVHNGTHIISWAVERAHNIVFALKNFIHTASSTAGMSKVDLKDNITMVLVLYHNQIKHGVEVELELDGLPDIMGYADELNQIWSNLINNALQAMEYQGVLTIKGMVDGPKVVLSFADTGCGIPDEIKETIFEPMFTTKPAGEGTGIGLDIVSKIVKKHNGEISIESKPGEGATFVVSLPVNQETSETGGVA